jgi:uncharacterized RDD family membrane protein YckC
MVLHKDDDAGKRAWPFGALLLGLVGLAVIVGAVLLVTRMIGRRVEPVRPGTTIPWPPPNR